MEDWSLTTIMHTYKTEKTEMVELEACILSSCHFQLKYGNISGWTVRSYKEKGNF